jgi:hypothetical protein
MRSSRFPRATIGAPNRITAFSAPLRRPRPRATARRQAEAEAHALSDRERRQKALDDAKLTTMEKLTDEEQDRILEVNRWFERGVVRCCHLLRCRVVCGVPPLEAAEQSNPSGACGV